ncbi:MAG: hypothetical protein KAT37_04830 [Candidatus Aenigmarchaeota archaeon]|nr:hypothetical protein [Candidatus Aenigmarchaeota archaeon]
MAKKSGKKTTTKKKAMKTKKEEHKADKRFLITLPIVLIILFCLYFFLQTDVFNTDECARIENPYLREKCYRDKAIDKGDPSICENIEDEEGCDSCRNEVEEALESGGGGSGGEGSGDGGGGTTGDPEIPEEGCEVLSGSDRDWCFREMAVGQTDPSICLEIIDDYYRDSCYRYIAMDTGDSSYCDYMEDSKRRKWCHEAVD